MNVLFVGADMRETDRNVLKVSGKEKVSSFLDQSAGAFQGDFHSTEQEAAFGE